VAGSVIVTTVSLVLTTDVTAMTSRTLAFHPAASDCAEFRPRMMSARESAKFCSRDGELDGDEDGLLLGLLDGEDDGDEDGDADGEELGLAEGLLEGEADGDALGLDEGLADGLALGLFDGLSSPVTVRVLVVNAMYEAASDVVALSVGSVVPSQ
jgi:hypothetical protein